jgi:hypothetical protein
MDFAKTKRQVVETAFIPTGALELAAQGPLVPSFGSVTKIL